jgi:hypothetical protein
MWARVGIGLYTVGSGFCGPGGLCNKIMLGLGVWPVGLAQKPGLHGLGLLGLCSKSMAQPY